VVEDDIDIVAKRLAEERKKRDLLISLILGTSIFLLGVITLIITENIKIPDEYKSTVLLLLLIIIWLAVTLGIYLALTPPKIETT
jgi:hypothetical protein